MAVRFETDGEPIPGYRLIDRLGSGGFGEVWRAEAPGGIFKAIKVIHGDLRSKDDDLVRYAEQELKAIKRVKTVRHPYLLSIDRYDVVDGRLCIVMELADCNLWDRFRECRVKGLPGIPRDELLQYMAEAAEVLDLMNDQFQLQHLDIKPQNLFLLHTHVKVADFGQVKDLEGHMASVTGGITPVYAAPETFDGFVSRFCDQYSLACVYQELLTGVRPFDGASMQQLLTQHLQLPPNLKPSPPADRPALARALAKKPEDRFPTVAALVRSLRLGCDPDRTPSVRPAAAAVPAGEPIVELAPAFPRADAPPPAVADTPPPAEAPPEQTGPGTVRPAVVIGIGQTGLRVLQAFRKYLADRYGAADRLPAVRFLFIDTDPDTLAAATADRPTDGLAGLHPDEVFPAKLNRAGHYLKPRLNGRSLVEGWFDTQLLYKLPRAPGTMGLRPLGRLAFCDHYRPLMLRLQAELDVCTDPDALADTAARLGLGLRTNRPRVYVVAGLGGATGGGMFLDVAYAVRTRLRRLGYDSPDVAGVLLAPPDGEDGAGPQARANAYAALTELSHYARPETVFQANYDDRYGTVRDPAPPFTATVILPGPAEPPIPLTPVGAMATAGLSGRVTTPLNRSGRAAFPANRSGYTPAPPQRSGVLRSAARVFRTAEAVAPTPRPAVGPDPCVAAADYLRLDLLAPVGRLLDATRPPAPPGSGPVTVRTFGLATLGWPRGEVVARTARYVAGVVFDHWVTPNFGRARDRVPGWAAEQLARLRLDPDGLIGRLRAAADRAIGQPVEPYLARALDPLAPRGWRPKPPDPLQVTLAFAHLDKLIGTPLLVANPPPNPVDDAARQAAADATRVGQADLTAVVPGLVDDPEFRLAGAEEATRQLLADVDRAAAAFADQVEQAEADARDAHERIWQSAHADAGGRKGATAEAAEALRRYPASQYVAVLSRHALKVYEQLKATLVGVLAEVSGCRQRLDVYRQQVVAELEEPPAAVGPRQVMPPGCPTIEAAAKKFLGVLSDDDLAELEHRIQETVEATTGGLYQACLNSAEGAEVLLRIVRDEARAYLDARLGEVDLAGMVAARYGGPDGAERALTRAFADAVPGLVGPGPWSRPGVAVVGIPAGPGGAGLAAAALAAAPAGVSPAAADTPDEVVVYREYPHVPLAALPQCGPAFVAAYHGAAEQFQCVPHTRVDVTQWVGVDAT